MYELKDFQSILREKANVAQSYFDKYPSIIPEDVHLFQEINDIKIKNCTPEIMVYGIYNAGKSSILNELIGEDVATEFSKAFTKEELNSEHILVPYPNNKYRLYLWNAISYTLQKSGVLKENIIVTDICTRCNPDYLFSHRIHGEKRGNLCAFLSLRK